MKASEFMIGDWVFLEGTPTKIRGVEIYCSQLYVQTNLTDAWYMSNFDPIPLTPEILEKNGFERDKNISLYNAYTGINSRVTLHDDFMLMNSRNMWHVHVDSEDYCTIANCELTYLHELQHLLRICKIDFEFSV